MKTVLLACIVAASAQPQLETVKELGDNMPTGVAVTASGRKFLCFPRWFQDQPQYQKAEFHVAELVGEGDSSELVDFPNKVWNSWKAGAAIDDVFVNVQSVFADHFDRLWILDVGAAYLEGVVYGAGDLEGDGENLLC